MRSVAAALLAVLAIPRAAAGEAAELEVRLGCEPAPGPGRVRCDVTLRAPAGSVLSWSDALIVAAPSFARPLRARVRPREPREGAASVEVPLALLATGTGRGELRVRARAVLCPATGGGVCRPAAREVAIELSVGRQAP